MRDWHEYLKQQEIKIVGIDDIKPYGNNPRDNGKAVPAVAKSIERFGFRNPILVDKDGVIIEGHTRRLAAIQLGMREVPVVYATDLTPEEVDALRVIDNKTAELADWDMDKLAEEIGRLAEAFSFADFGFDIGSLVDMGVEDAGSKDDFDYETGEDGNPAVEPRTKRGEIWRLGNHVLMCGDSTSKEDVDRLMEGTKADCLITDPPYNVDIEGSAGKIENDNMGDAQFDEFLGAVFKRAAESLKPGGAFYVWHASRTQRAFENAMNAAGMECREQLIWVKDNFTLGRQDYQWRHEPCHPAGTMIRTPKGEVPIEKLRDGDRVVAFDPYSGMLKGLRDGIPVKVGKRRYKGEMYHVEAVGRSVRATDNHHFTVRFNGHSKFKYCTYLMRKGDWWRVGITKAYDARQFGIKTRFNQNLADEAWLISAHETRVEAQVYEQILTCKYGVPYTTWEVAYQKKQDPTNANLRNDWQIADIYKALDLAKLDRNAKRLLADHGRSADYPLVDKSTKRDKFSRRSTARIRACNIVPDLMEVPIPRGGYSQNDWRLFDWKPVESVRHESFTGLVWSLDVPKWHHYIADGIVVHNCFYGWRDGAAHKWTSDRSQTTVLEFPKPSKSPLHPTSKPIPLIRYQMENSTDYGDTVLDLFGGSGTTLIAAERSGRKCRMMELDPKYATVIIDRWEAETGQKAERIAQDGAESGEA